MKATTNVTPADSEHPPLARDSSGNPIAFPSNTSAWRVCRPTTGRPRAVTGPDDEPLRLPLSTTCAQLADMCGADTYRVYAVDEVGEVISHVSTVSVGGEPRNAMSVDGPAPANKSLFAATSDLRYALETITQMARTNAEAMRSIAESQADLVKAVALTKGLPRNFVMPRPPPPPDDDDDDDDDDDEDEEDDDGDGEATAPRSPQTNAIETLATMIGPFIPGLMESWNIKKAGAANDQATNIQPTATNGMAHLARIQLRLNAPERKFLELMLADLENGDAVATAFAAKTVDDVVATIQRGVSSVQPSVPPSPRPVPPRQPISFTDPAVMQKVMAVSKLLDPSERARLMKLAPRLMASPEAQELAAKLLDRSDENAAAWIHMQLDEIERKFAS